MEITARKTVAACSVILVFLLSLYFVYLSRLIILYLLIAIMLSISISPLVTLVQKRKIKKVPAVILSDILLVIILVGILATIVIPIAHEMVNFIQNLPQISHKIATNPTLIAISHKYHFENTLSQLTSNISTNTVIGGTGSILIFTRTLIAKITAVTIVLVLTFLLQIEGENIWNSLLSFLRGRDSRVARRIGTKTARAISGFVSGNLFISLVAGVVTFITLWILHVPYKFALSVLVAIFDLIPLVGAAIATVAVGLVALSQGVIVAILAVSIILLYQFIEGHLIQPIVYSRSISLSALIVVVASVLGAEVGGIIGILLAIPLAAVVQIVVIEIYEFLAATKEIAR